MNVEQFCERIQLHPGAKDLVVQYPMDDEQYESFKRRFYEDSDAFFEQMKQLAEYRQLFLCLFVKFAVDLHEEYRLRGIEDQVYFDTFSDIQIWCMECHRVTGEYGIQEYRWLREHALLRLFRLGRLQFQPYVMKCDVQLDGKKILKNQIVLNVHIPAGDALEDGKLEESFKLAKAFFRGIPPVFICHSWLLEPNLAEILKPGSNILQFQKHFSIYQLDPESRQAEERIFQLVSSDYTQYPENTNLQRSAKAYLLSGRKLGSAYGIKA